MIEFIVNGTPYTDFVDAKITKSLSSLSNDFEFTASSVNGFPPFKEGQDVECLVNGETLVTGKISRISGSESEGAHTITYSGRDNTKNLVDSSIDNLGDLASNITLKKLIEIVIAHIGADIEVIDNLNPAPFNQAEDNIKPQAGDNCFEFLSLYANKRQAVLTSDNQGRVVITQSAQTRSGLVIQSLINSPNNNTLSQDWDVISDERFNKYIFRGQQDPLAVNFAGETAIRDVVNRVGMAVDSDIEVGRQLVVLEGVGFNNTQLENRAMWSKQLAQARAVTYSCTVKGHDQGGAIWQENTLVLVNSEAADISRDMLLNTVTFQQSESGGGTTDLEFVERDVYTIDLAIRNQKQVGSQNDVFVG